MSKIEEIRAREQAATPGPWFYKQSDIGFDIVYDEIPIGGGNKIEKCVGHILKENDAKYIAHAREDIPWMLDRNARLTERIEALERAIEYWRTTYDVMQEERDQWRARVEALERAIKTKLTACSTCVKKPPEGYCDELYNCINEDWSYPCWQFNEQRFRGGERE